MIPEGEMTSRLLAGAHMKLALKRYDEDDLDAAAGHLDLAVEHLLEAERAMRERLRPMSPPPRGQPLRLVGGRDV